LIRILADGGDPVNSLCEAESLGEDEDFEAEEEAEE
jgi:hypothetical protein